MEITPAENVVLERFYEKARLAGGARPGYMLRKQAVCSQQQRHPDLDLAAALGSLTDKQLLKVNEGGELFYLTESGAGKLGELFG